MKTINQFINLYNSVLNGVSTELYGHIISSDGINWIVDGRPTDTLKNKLDILNFVIEKCELAREFIKISGFDESNMYDEYFIILDSIDGMIMLVSNIGLNLNFIYMVSTSVVVEQINKKDGIMRCEMFNFDGQFVKQKTLIGKLSKKSITNIIDMDRKENMNITQNFFYDMLFEGMSTYNDLINADTTKIENFVFQKKLSKNT